MTQEDKELLIKDMSARLPYEVKVLYDNWVKKLQYVDAIYNEVRLLDYITNYTVDIDDVKPYLFPLSSMTEEHQKEEYNICAGYIIGYEYNLIDFYNKYHYDYRGLIPMGLAIDATGLNIY
jgi:hypothetical protein